MSECERGREREREHARARARTRARESARESKRKRESERERERVRERESMCVYGSIPLLICLHVMLEEAAPPSSEGRSPLPMETNTHKQKHTYGHIYTKHTYGHTKNVSMQMSVSMGVG